MELKMAYAMRGESFVPVREFQSQFAQSQAKIRPTDLTCPECDQDVVVRYPRDPNVKTVAVHYAHTPRLDPEYRCALNNPESADHFNAKIYLARQMERAVQASRGFALVFRCRAEGCRQQEIFFEIKDYDKVQPERKVGRVRPDISCFQQETPIGAAEVCHTHAVDLEKQYDLEKLGVNWFEIPAKNLKDWARGILPFSSTSGGYTIYALDAHLAQISYPQIPMYCEVCERRYKRQGIMASAYQEQVARYKQVVARHVESTRADRAASDAALATASDERARIEAEFYAQSVTGADGQYVTALTCLYCAHPALLQGRSGAGVWYCSRCRIWITSADNGPKIILANTKGATN